MTQKENFQVILFSSPPFGVRLQKIYGIHRIATEIRDHGYSCQIVHFFVSFEKHELKLLLKKLIGKDTLVVGFSSTFWSWTTFENEEKTIELVNFIIDESKKINPHIKTIGGGSGILEVSGAVIGKKTFRKKFLTLDAAFDGFPESVLINYLNSLKNKQEIPKPTEIAANGTYVYKFNDKLDTFDFNRSTIKYVPEDYIIPSDTSIIETARGCIFKCKFCSFRLNGKDKFDYIKDSETMKDELIENYEKYKLQYYILSDDTFNDSTYKIESLHKIFTSLPFKIKFSTYLRLDLLYHHPEQISMLKEMGLTGAMFGVETFHEQAARSIGKGISGDKSKELLHNLKHKFWKNDVKIEVALITGLPFETIESYNETKAWILDSENLVETIRVNTLGLQNPLIYNSNDADINGFSKDSSKYGFYFPNPNSHLWKKMTGDIKSFEEADEIKKDLELAAKNTCRRFQGGFGIFSFWPKLLASGVKYKFDDLVKMDRFEYEKFIQQFFNHDINNLMIQKYKNNFF